jgi:hypothetical protein
MLFALVHSKMACTPAHHHVAEATVMVLTSPAKNVVVPSILVVHLLTIWARPCRRIALRPAWILRLLKLLHTYIELQLPAIDFNLVQEHTRRGVSKMVIPTNGLPALKAEETPAIEAGHLVATLALLHRDLASGALLRLLFDVIHVQAFVDELPLLLDHLLSSRPPLPSRLQNPKLRLRSHAVLPRMPIRHAQAAKAEPALAALHEMVGVFDGGGSTFRTVDYIWH